MGEQVTLVSTGDGFRFPAWHEPAREARRGGLVMLPAIWGVTPHLRALAAEWAGEGWEVLVPSLFEREDPGFAERDLDPARMAHRMALAASTGQGDSTPRDTQAAVDWLAPRGPVFVMGFCFGGTAAWVAACRCRGIAAASCFYGGHIVRFVDETPRCPVLLHFGRQDELITPADVEAIAARHPDIPIHLYEAGHAFVAPGGRHEDSARLAILRTKALFTRTGGGREAGS